jgi:glycosyltransferase involved in cell wall biosynthesis
MRIGIDVRTFSYRRGGITQYTYQLIRHLLAVDAAHTYHLFNFNRGPCRWESFGKRVEQVVIRLPQRWGLKRIWERVLLPWAVRRKKIDLYFGPDFYVPPGLQIPSVATVHDLMFLALPEFAGRPYTGEMLSRVRGAVQRARAVIVPSRHTEKDVKRLLQVPAEKMRVIYEAADVRFRPQPEVQSRAVTARYGVDGPFVLFVGQTTRQKNLHRVCRAFRAVREQHGAAGYTLVVVGKETADTAAIRREIDPAIRSDVRFVGYVPDEELPYFYSAADLFVFVSRYEGFGIPLLEAMGCGVPVLASHAASIPEVVGDAALLVDPENEAAIARGMVTLLRDTSRARHYRERGSLRASAFSWNRAARETLATFQEVAGSLPLSRGGKTP